MERFYDNGCLLQIVDNSVLDTKGVELLTGIALMVPDVLDVGVGASSAPRHGNPDRAEFVHLRRLWFRQKRGTVRHTLQDIAAFLQDGGNTLRIGTHGPQCETGAHAYTPEGQYGRIRDIFLCDLFFKDNAAAQISTLVHELTHLIRETEDIEVSAEDDVKFMTTEQQVAMTSQTIIDAKKKYFRDELRSAERVGSAYNYEYFIFDLVNQAFRNELPRAARRT